MQVANTREDCVKDIFYDKFVLLQVEMEGFFKISHTSYVHISMIHSVSMLKN